ncbi:hypothetical protein [Pulveribacter sp.]|uniref:hypothetical protein n=1 Tax=Pulveribacter sp. TaxID=2678893 RepID=UPI0028AD4440|nr:hypothetical protein [Pulveribacter sp.]
MAPPLHSLRAPLLGAALLAAAAAAQAAHPLITDDTGTQGAGRWQFELNTDHTRARDRYAGTTAWERELNATLTRGPRRWTSPSTCPGSAWTPRASRGCAAWATPRCWPSGASMKTKPGAGAWPCALS